MARGPEERGGVKSDGLPETLAKRYTARASYKDVLDQRGNALMTINEKFGPASTSYRALAAKVRKDEEQVERIKTAVRRPIARWHVRTVVMVLIALGLALLEAPANKFLFDVALQSSGFVSYCVSAGVTAFLLAMAHFAGRGLRQIWSDYRRKVIWSNLFVFLFCTGLAATITGVLTVARAAFASQGGSIADLLSGVGTSLQSLGPIGAFVAALGDTSALVLASINLGGIAVTMMVAFFSHDSDRDFDHVQTSYERNEKALSKIDQAYLREREKTISHYAPDLIGFAANYNTANARVVELKARQQLPLDDDDRFVLTDLDQMSEVAEQIERAELNQDQHAQTATSGRREPTIATMSDYRRDGT
jgi:hypothetical protein